METRDIIAEVSRSTGLTSKQAEKVLEILLDLITMYIFSSRSALVEIKGFGTFSSLVGNSSGSFDIKTGEQITFGGHVAKMKFRAESSMKKLGVRFRAEKTNLRY